jgi:hypothetical protein
MKSFAKIGVVLLAALTLAAYSSNAQTASTAPSTNNPAAAKPKPKSKKYAGKVVSVDNDAKTIAVTLSSGASQTIHVTSKTHIRKDGQPATLADVTAGEHIYGSEHQNDAQDWVATTVTIGEPKKAAPAGTNSAPAAAQ